MTIPEEHHKSLSVDFYSLCRDLSSFTEDEKRLLVRFGTWLEALAVGKIRPFTPAQQRFVRVTRGEDTAQSQFEVAWMKLIQQRAAEKVPGFVSNTATFSDREHPRCGFANDEGWLNDNASLPPW